MSQRQAALAIILDVGDQQVGALFRAVRIRGRNRQVDVATAAGVARWSVSAIERGHLDSVAIGQLRSIASALEIRVELDASWRGGDGARIVNERHSRMHELVGARLTAMPGWEFATEVTFSEYGERGAIDILAWHAATRTLLVIELKTELPDPAGLVAQVDRYRRLAPKVGRDRGWDASSVAAWVLVAESDFNRRQVARHARDAAQRLPARRSLPARLAGRPIRSRRFRGDADPRALRCPHRSLTRGARQPPSRFGRSGRSGAHPWPQLPR